MQTYDVLVTGSAGHLGHALMLILPALGYKPLGIDILSSTTTSFVGSFADRSFVSHILSKNPGIRSVIHAGGLHKPHIVSHTNEEFIQTNVTGTMILVDEVSKCKQPLSFVLVSTTSVFGKVLSPNKGEPAVWVDENLIPVPKNIYGVSKLAAEDICYLFHQQTKLPLVVLRVSRFFPQPDDDDMRRNAMCNDNLKVLELSYRRVDIRDVVDSCVAAMEKAREIGWGRYVISAPTLFHKDENTLRRLNSNADELMRELLPKTGELFEKTNWKYLSIIDRVYDSTKAQRELGWKPRYTLQLALDNVEAGKDWRSQLAIDIGRRGYHSVSTAFYTSR
ncbi:hypothetical protein QQS21_000467 [Conoideocrella luteorostrata]|uniref:NAD-dependent epimerase/dehydratase domain-containing protein n=1 Tax=Conoideocrella luteorostrata TaxID=1105319 RepID=A0AAJ0CYX9_9HYPO|nr:hypothetical protein QQS21_000467 [Conoideocrella luteorostrata]